MKDNIQKHKDKLVEMYMELEGCSEVEALAGVNKLSNEEVFQEIEWVGEMLEK